MTVNDSYRTKDFEEIVYLLIHDIPIAGVERQGPNEVVFIFKNRGLCDGWLATMAYDDSASVSKCLLANRQARKIIRNTP